MVTKLPAASPLYIPKEPQLTWGDLLLKFPTNTLPLPVKTGEVFHFQQARYALFHGIQQLGICPGERILVPAFHCSTLVEAVLRTGVDVCFYNIQPNLILDFEDLAQKVDGQTKGLLIIHFFGVRQPLEQIQNFCREHHLWLIEDCAHILRGQYDGQDLGSFGDVSVFSWRKFFQIPDGGSLVVPKKVQGRNPELQKGTFLQTMKDFRWGAGQCVDAWRNRNRSRLGNFLASDVRWDTLPGLRRSNPVEDFDNQMVTLGERWFSLNYLKNCDLNLVIEKRNRNWQLMAQSLGNRAPYLNEWGHIWQHATAWAFPLLMTGYENFHVKLRQKGIPAFTWGGVIHRSLELEKFPDAKLLFSNLVLLPIHQDLTPSAIDYITKTVRSLINENAMPG